MDFGIGRGIPSPHQVLAEVDGQTGSHGDDGHLGHKLPRFHKLAVEVCGQHDDGQEVCPKRHELRKDEECNAAVVHFNEDHVQLRQDEGCEGDADDLEERLREDEDDEEHDGAPLVHGHPNPHQEHLGDKETGNGAESQAYGDIVSRGTERWVTK